MPDSSQGSKAAPPCPREGRLVSFDQFHLRRPQYRFEEIGRAYRTAEWFRRNGFWPVLLPPSCSPRVGTPGKAPIGRDGGAVRPTAEGLKAAYRRHPRAGVGLKLGAEGGVIDIDVDDPERA